MRIRPSTELLLDSEASLRLVDRALTDLQYDSPLEHPVVLSGLLAAPTPEAAEECPVGLPGTLGYACAELRSLIEKLRQSREVLRQCPTDSDHDLPEMQRDELESFASPMETADISAQRLGYAWSVFLDVEKRLVDLEKVLGQNAAAAPADTQVATG